VIHLVLQGAGQKAGGFELHRLAGEIFSPRFDAMRANDIGAEFREAQATLDAFLFVFSTFEDRVEQYQGHVLLDLHGLSVDEHLAWAILDPADVDHGQLNRNADLLGGKADAIGGAHGFKHVVRELAGGGVHCADVCAFRAEHGVSVFNDFEDHEARAYGGGDAAAASGILPTVGHILGLRNGTKSSTAMRMLLWREKIPDTWLPKVRSGLPEVLVDHAHLERKAATSAINMEKYIELRDSVSELNAIAIEDLQHFEIVLGLLRERGIPFVSPQRSPWITGMMKEVRRGRRQQVIDHLVVCALIEGRSCEKFQILSEAIRDLDPKLADFYASLVESEGNHYATYLIMARHIDEEETARRLDFFLDLDAVLIKAPNPHPMLH
jgi:tRNA-(ms[2]io[6]A)-hydroxylase